MYWTCKNNRGADPTCSDVDECETDNGGCDTAPKAKCTNNSGAAASCSCPSGYSGDGRGSGGCADIDECKQSGVCGEVGVMSCRNTPGDYECICDAGHTGQHGCVDIDECTGSTVCTAEYPCVNLSPLYKCRGQFTDWPPAYSGTYVVNDNGTVMDKRTNLLWQGGLPGSYDGCSGSQSLMGETCTWDEAKAVCARLSLFGTGWRLPTIAELESLVDDTRVKPALDSTMFPDASMVTSYWAASEYVGDRNFAWAVNFDSGVSFVGANKSNLFRVRCVRTSEEAIAASGKGVAPPGRYEIDADTVRDTKTGLTWQRKVDPTSRAQPDAGAYCKASTLSGGRWRVPTRAELLSLTDRALNAPAIDSEVFPDTPLARFWTSTPAAANSSNYSWVVSFADGASNDLTNSTPARVRCVRD